MQIQSLRPDLVKYLKKHGLVKKYTKQISLLIQNSHHPSLHLELLEPKKLKIYSIRIDIKYRAVFIILKNKQIEIVDINDHYQ